MCNVFCERLGRGHIHLELCTYDEGKCVEEQGRRHQTKEYMPDPKLAKDEVQATSVLFAPLLFGALIGPPRSARAAS